MKEALKLSAPWITYFKKIQALFRLDKEVRVTFDNEYKTIKLYVDNHQKAEALSQLLPLEKTFGNVVVAIDIIPPNDEFDSNTDLLTAAFKNNSAVSYIKHIDSPFGGFDYVVFNNQVVQFYNDNMRDINGNLSTLYEDIASDVFENTDNVFYCTDIPDDKEDVKIKDNTSFETWVNGL